ncbi:MAG: dephospho-CoA kinase [Gemmatimonadota bacterium]|nr:dephospho-CoA kinase [Gemmatimonadota bacterium]
MLSVALTGNIASGKSSVALLFERWGARLIDADAIVRELQQPGTPVFQRIADRFGPAVIAPDGTLDRAALRSLVFRDDRAREDLNAIVHPAVRARRDQLMAAARAAGVPVVVQDIPLLFETLDPGAFDLVVLVDAPVDVRRARLMADRRLSRDEADRMIGAQLPAAPKRARSHLVIENDADLAVLERRARAAWEEISRIAAERA